MESVLLVRRDWRAWVLLASVVAALCSFTNSPGSATPLAPGITISSKALGLEFQTPKNFRLAMESTEEQLLLFGHSKKTSPLLRVRVFNGRRSPMERMPEMKRVLMDAESKVKTVSADRWQHEGRSFQTARATVKDGAAEYVVLFTLADQPKKVQHAFWLYGKTKEVDKAWEAVQASIASAKSIGTIGKPGVRDSDESDEPKADAPDAWKDDKTGLTLKRWPEGFVLENVSKDLLATEGIELKPKDSSAHESTWFRVRAALDQGKDAASKASKALSDELGTDATARGVSTVSMRVAGISATKHRWTQEASGGPFLRETYLFQKGTALFQIEFSAQETWAKARSRRTLVRDFISGVRF